MMYFFGTIERINIASVDLLICRNQANHEQYKTINASHPWDKRKTLARLHQIKATFKLDKNMPISAILGLLDEIIIVGIANNMIRSIDNIEHIVPGKEGDMDFVYNGDGFPI